VDAVIVLLAFVLLAVVIAVIAAPLRAGLRESDSEDAQAHAAARESERRSVADHVELEAARETKYREIRDAELDYRTGKLSHEDYAAIDAALRAEALAILDQLEVLERCESRVSNPRLEG
jgi:hypothetical protein